MFPRTLRLVLSFLFAFLAQAALADKSTDFSNIGGALSGTNVSLRTGATFADRGSFTIDGYGANGVVDGVLFSGAFSGPVTWTLTTLANGTHNYTLTTVVTGTMGSTAVQGVTVQLTMNTGTAFFNGSTSIAGDTTMVSFVPEPSTLAMLSTGLLAIGAGMRRRFIG